MALAAPAAHADNGFDVDSTSRYVLQAKEDVVRATMTMTVRNERPSYRTGNYIQYFYLPSNHHPGPRGRGPADCGLRRRPALGDPGAHEGSEHGARDH